MSRHFPRIDKLTAGAAWAEYTWARKSSVPHFRSLRYEERNLRGERRAQYLAGKVRSRRRQVAEFAALRKRAHSDPTLYDYLRRQGVTIAR